MTTASRLLACLMLLTSAACSDDDPGVVTVGDGDGDAGDGDGDAGDGDGDAGDGDGDGDGALCDADSDCDDLDACNGVEICGAAGRCTEGDPVTVDDGVACTDDSCDAATGDVTHAADDGSCDNGLYCDGLEYCDADADCQPGTAPVVDDGVDCTDDSCDEDAELVTNAINHGNCGNGMYCDGAEVCDAVDDCQPGTPPVVDDGVGCTDDTCDEANNAVIHQPNHGLCPSDNRFCVEADHCDLVNDCVAGSVRSDGYYEMDGQAGPVGVYCDGGDTLAADSHGWGLWGADLTVVIRERDSPGVGSDQDWSRTCGLFGADAYLGQAAESGDTYATPGSPAFVDSQDYWQNFALNVFPDATHDDILILQDADTPDCWAHYANAGSLQSFGSPAGGGAAFCDGGAVASKPYHIYLCQPAVNAGIVHDRSIAALQASGWSVCYAHTYDEFGVGVSTAAGIRGSCDNAGTELLVGCTDDVIDGDNLVVSASDLASVVLPAVDDAGGVSDHRVGDGNVGWYLTENDSFGFFEGGDGVSRMDADISTGGFPQRRLSWNTLDWIGGYRCGATVNLNANGSWTKYILAR